MPLSYCGDDKIRLSKDKPRLTVNPSRALQAVKKCLHRETEVAVGVMLPALLREPIETRQAAQACVRRGQRYRASHVDSGDLLDPLGVKLLTGSENPLPVRPSQVWPDWQRLPGRAR